MIISGSKQRQIPPPGIYIAYLAWWIELGTQLFDDEWEWKFSSHWELSETRATFKKERGPEPFLLRKEITANIGKRSNMRKIAEAMFGRSLTGAEVASFDTEKVRTCGKPLMVVVTHKPGSDGETYPKIIDFAPVPKGTTVPPQILPTLHYRIEDGTGGDFVKLPSWLQDKILSSRELGGERSTKSDIARRNMAKATENALAEQEPGDDEADDDEDDDDDVFDLDKISDEELRDPQFVDGIRQTIDSLPCSNAEKANQYRYLNQLIRRAKEGAPLDPAEVADIDDVNKRLAAEFNNGERD